MDAMRRLEHASFDGPELNCAPLLVNALDGEDCSIQALSTMPSQADLRSTGASWVLPMRVAKARKPAVRC